MSASDEDRWRAISSHLADRVEAGIPGCFAYVEEADGTSTFIAAGAADLTSDRPMTPTDHYRIGSATKTFTAVVVLQLIDEGRLQLSDPVARWLDLGAFQYGAQLSVEHLLRMRSGLSDFADAPSLQGLEANLIPHTLEESLRLGLQGEALHEPGMQSTYCNTNFCVLERLVERVTGRSLAEEIAARIAVPLGLSDTSYPAEDDLTLPEPYIRGYDWTGEAWRECSRVYFGRGDGGVISTAVDVATFFRALFDGRLVPPDTLRQMTTVIRDEPPPQYLYGMGLIADPLPRRVVWGHSGRGYGYGHHPFMDLETGRLAIWMLNGTHGFRRNAGAERAGVRFSPEERMLAYK